MREKKTGKDSGRLLHAVRVSKFLQVTVLAAGVLGMSAASQSMTEISEKEQRYGRYGVRKNVTTD